MSIPIATTTITVKRSEIGDDEDPYEPSVTPPITTVVTGLPAHIGSPGGRETLRTGTQEVVEWRLGTDPADIRSDDVVTDERTGETYHVIWARNRTAAEGSGVEDLAHVEGGLRQVRGISD